MSIPLPTEVIQLLADPETIKILGTVSLDGVPHVVSKGSIHAGADGNIHLLQVLEHSQSNRNLTHSLWFDRKVTVYLRGKQGISYQIKGRPVRNLIAGPLFEEHYVKLRARLGDVDLAGVWIITPEELINETGAVRQSEEATRNPYLLHLDRLAKQNA
jgi:hypothetical protein